MRRTDGTEVSMVEGHHLVLPQALAHRDDRCVDEAEVEIRVLVLDRRGPRDVRFGQKPARSDVMQLRGPEVVRERQSG